MLTVSGAGPDRVSKVAPAIGGVPEAPPIRTTVVGRFEKLSFPSKAWVVSRKTPGELNVIFVPGPEKQHRPDEPAIVVDHTSQMAGFPPASSGEKFTVTTVPAGPDRGETLSDPEGGWPAVAARIVA